MKRLSRQQRRTIKRDSEQRRLKLREGKIEERAVAQFVNEVAYSQTLLTLHPEQTAVGSAQSALNYAQTTLERLAAPFPIACRTGCSFCCYAEVRVSALEVFAIAETLQTTLSPEKLVEVTERVVETAQAIRGLTGGNRFRQRIPCPLLSANHTCSVYPVRPLACWTYTSNSAEICQEAFERADPHYGIYPDPARYTIAGSLSRGIESALNELEVQGESLELVAALRVALTLPNARERWNRGEHIFKSDPKR